MYLLAGGPFILLGLIALDSRINRSDWQFVEYGYEASQRIYAYQRPVELAMEIAKGNPTDQRLEYTVGYWIDAYRSGLLEDIAPATALMDGTSGPYLQVLSAKHGLIDCAIEYAARLEERGEREKATQVLVQAFELAEIGKYSDFGSYASGSVKQSRILKKLIASLPEITECKRADISHRLSAVLESRKTIDDVMDNVAAAYRADKRRAGEKPIELMVATSSERLASSESRLADRFEEWQKLATGDPNLISLYGKSRIAFLQHKELEQSVSIAKFALDPLMIN